MTPHGYPGGGDAEGYGPPADHPEHRSPTGPPRPRGEGIVARTFREVPATAWLIVVNLLAYVVTAAQALDPLQNSRSSLFLHTALYPPLVGEGRWWLLLTNAFEHFGPLHLLLNMYMAWILGFAAENAIGHLRYLALYLVSAVGGSVAVLYVDPDALTAGASGALFGVMGAYAVVALALRQPFRGIAILIGLNLAVGLLVPGVSMGAHLGGLLAGALGALAGVVVPRLLGPDAGRGLRDGVSWAGMAIVLALVLVAGMAAPG